MTKFTCGETIEQAEHNFSEIGFFPDFIEACDGGFVGFETRQDRDTWMAQE